MSGLIAIVGRPNVGKSTLFNRLIGERKAIVDDRPGVTRDRLYGQFELGGRTLEVVDTGGLEIEASEGLFANMRHQVDTAMKLADVILFVVERQLGLTAADELTAKYLRSHLSTESLDKMILVVNKCDVYDHELEAADFWALGFPNLVCVSAEHGRSIFSLLDAIEQRLPENYGEADSGLQPIGGVPIEVEEWDDDEQEKRSADGYWYLNAEPKEAIEDEDSESKSEAEEEEPEIFRVAVLGRPNIGKSTLINRFLGEERQVVHDMPGTTMDSVDSQINIDGTEWCFVDTAGIRRRARIDDRLEGYAVSRAIRTIERCHICLLMIDGTEGFTAQDARLAALISDRGRGCVILINRWDEVKKMEERNSSVLLDDFQQTLPHLQWAPVLFISALTGKGCHRILPEVKRVYKNFDRRISTSKINRFLADVVAQNPPPQKHHHRVRLNYMTQTRVRPPTYVIWGNSPDAIPPSYRRYLENRLRERFVFVGSPIRIQLREKRRLWEKKQQE